MFNEIAKGFTDVLPLIEKSAPAIASALGSPLSGFAISFLANVLNHHPMDIPGIAQSLVSDPDIESKLKSAQDDYLDWMKNLLPNRSPTTAEINIKLSWENGN